MCELHLIYTLKKMFISIAYTSPCILQNKALFPFSIFLLPVQDTAGLKFNKQFFHKKKRLRVVCTDLTVGIFLCFNQGSDNHTYQNDWARASAFQLVSRRNPNFCKLLN